jgi:hypothetical protein
LDDGARERRAENHADEMGLGPLDSMPVEQSQAVLKHVELKMPTESVVRQIMMATAARSRR